MENLYDFGTYSMKFAYVKYHVFNIVDFRYRRGSRIIGPTREEVRGDG